MSAASGERLMSRLLHCNPAVATQELRRQMRGWRPFASVLAWTVLCTLAVLTGLVIYAINSPGRSAYHGGMGSQERDAGALAFTILIATEMGVLLLLVPIQAAAAIAGEREKQTIEMLRATLLTARDVVTGKLVSSMAMAVLLVLIAIPVATWCLTLGGVSRVVVFWSHTYLPAAAFWLATLGLVFSAWRPRCTDAIGWTLGAMLIIILGPPGFHLLANGMGMIYYGAASDTVLNAVLGALIAVGAGVTWGTLKLFRFLYAALGDLGWAQARRRMAAVVGSIGTFTLFWLALVSYAFTAADETGLLLLATGNPVLGIAALLSTDFTEEILGSSWGTWTGAIGPGNGVDLRWLLWAVATGSTLFWGCINWLLATRVLARHREEMQ